MELETLVPLHIVVVATVVCRSFFGSHELGEGLSCLRSNYGAPTTSGDLVYLYPSVKPTRGSISFTLFSVFAYYYRVELFQIHDGQNRLLAVLFCSWKYGGTCGSQLVSMICFVLPQGKYGRITAIERRYLYPANQSIL